MDAAPLPLKLKDRACSDLGAAGIGAAICESARYGAAEQRLTFKSALSITDITPQEILICETQARYVVHVAPENVDEVLKAIREKTEHTAVIGEITSDDKEIFMYNGEIIATIPNNPSKEMIEALISGNDENIE